MLANLSETASPAVRRKRTHCCLPKWRLPVTLTENNFLVGFGTMKSRLPMKSSPVKPDGTELNPLFIDAAEGNLNSLFVGKTARRIDASRQNTAVS
ncbi:hypothetical protein BaRGS_00035333 [Batillaria attramentaria]|uniref:Uncharacterized protein n=1 Tax=Batillaria attramentaria TaxID=370345 RepID=A0ABD0JF00_9CAEN